MAMKSETEVRPYSCGCNVSKNGCCYPDCMIFLLFDPCSSLLPQAMKKTELLDSVVEKTGVTKVTAGKILSAFTESIAESLAAGKKGKCW